MIPEVSSDGTVDHSESVNQHGSFFGRHISVLPTDAYHEISKVVYRAISRLETMASTAKALILRTFSRWNRTPQEKLKKQIEADLSKELKTYCPSGNFLLDMDQFGEMANEWALTWDAESKHIAQMSEKLQALCESIVATSIARAFNDKKTRRKLEDQKVDRERAEVLAREIVRAYLARIYRDREKHLRSSIKKVVSKQKKTLVSVAKPLEKVGNTGCLTVVNNAENELNAMESLLMGSADLEQLFQIVFSLVQHQEGRSLFDAMKARPRLTVDDHLVHFSRLMHESTGRLSEVIAQDNPKLAEAVGGFQSQMASMAEKKEYSRLLVFGDSLQEMIQKGYQTLGAMPKDLESLLGERMVSHLKKYEGAQDLKKLTQESLKLAKELEDRVEDDSLQQTVQGIREAIENSIKSDQLKRVPHILNIARQQVLLHYQRQQQMPPAVQQIIQNPVFQARLAMIQLLRPQTDEARENIQTKLNDLQRIYQVLEERKNIPCARAVKAISLQWESLNQLRGHPRNLLFVRHILEDLYPLLSSFESKPSMSLSEHIKEQKKALMEAHGQLVSLVDKDLGKVLKLKLQSHQKEGVGGVLSAVYEHYQKIGKAVPPEVQDILQNSIKPRLEILELIQNADKVLDGVEKRAAQLNERRNQQAYDWHAHIFPIAKAWFVGQPAYVEHIDKILKNWEKRLLPIKTEKDSKVAKDYWDKHKFSERMAAESRMLEIMALDKEQPLVHHACEVSKALQARVREIVRRLQTDEKRHAKVRRSFWYLDRRRFDELGKLEPKATPAQIPQYGHWVQKIEKALGDDIPERLAQDIAQAHHLRRVLRSFISN